MKVQAVAVRVVLGLGVILVLHAVLVTLLLATGGLGWLLARSTGVVKVDAGHSFSVWPGVVHLRQLHLEVTDSNVHLALDVPSGKTHIDLGALLQRRFVADSLTGEHFVLRMKPRFRALPEDRRAALPPLSEPKRAARQAEQTYLWPIRIAGIAASFDELWVSELRYLGDARVAGGFQLQPREKVSIDPTDIQLLSGILRYGPEQGVLNVQRFACHAELPETRVEELKQAWRERLQARVELTGRVLDLSFVGKVLPQWGALSGGEGDLSVRAAAQNGQWVGGFEVDYASEHVGYTAAGLRASTTVVLAARAPASAEGGAEGAPLLPAELRLGPLSIAGEQGQLALLQEARLALQVTREFPLGMPRSVQAGLKELRLDKLQQLPAAWRPTSWSPRSARVPHARAELDWRDGAYKGGAELAFADVSFALGEWSVRQSGSLALEGLRWPGPGYKLRLSAVRLDLDPVSLQDADTKIDDWRLKLRLDDVAVALLERRVDAGFSARGDDARPVLSLLGVQGLPQGAADFLAMPDLSVFGHVTLAPELQELAIDRAESKTIDVRGRFVRRNTDQHAALLFKAAPLSLGVTVKPTDTSVKLFAGDAWLDTNLRTLDAALDQPATAARAP